MKKSVFTIWGFIKQIAVATCLVVAFAAWLSPAAAQDRMIDDIDITHAIEDELAIDGEVESHLIDVSANEGIVTLSGTVNSLLERDRAVEIAGYTKGVRAIVEDIDVVPAVSKSDAELRFDVENALIRNAVTESYELNVEVDNSIVTLKGTVQSWAERTQAAVVASGVEGVEGIINNVEVSYETTRPDSEIETDIQGRLDNDVRIDAELIEVDVENGNVELSGTVGSVAEKNIAENYSRVMGVKSVSSDDLEIKWWARDEMIRVYDNPLTDQAIEGIIKDQFTYDPRVYSFNPEVNVDEGVATLTGTVEDLSAKNAAEEIALNTVGVWRVKNYIKVRPVNRPTDAEIEDRVVETISGNPYLDIDKIDVEVFNGKVYLTGNVRSEFQSEEAGEAASMVSGVVEVENSLVITGEWARKDDLEIRENVESQLFWSPYVGSEKITVEVNDGIVTLTGTVNNWNERRVAVQNAIEGGAKDVINHLKVDNFADELWSNY